MFSTLLITKLIQIGNTMKYLLVANTTIIVGRTRDNRGG
jgi:hypothetical protein